MGKIIHGMHKHPLFKTWISMRARCYKKWCTSYPNYGGRGITVCERWRNSFPNFLADMGERPPGHSIDRIDNDGNYEPSNCRWATPKQQTNNQRPRRLFRGGFKMIGSIFTRGKSLILSVSLRGGNLQFIFHKREDADDFKSQLSYEREFQRRLERLHFDSAIGLLVQPLSN